jgi:hypothetical protein
MPARLGDGKPPAKSLGGQVVADRQDARLCRLALGGVLPDQPLALLGVRLLGFGGGDFELWFVVGF